MAGPWIFFTLIGLLVVVQLSDTRSLGIISPIKSRKRDEENATAVLKEILGSLRRINNIFTFKILDDEARRLNLESQIAKSSPQRKCRLQALLFGKPCETENNSIKEISDEEDSEPSILTPGKRKPDNHSPFKSLDKPTEKSEAAEKDPKKNAKKKPDGRNSNTNVNVNINHKDKILNDKNDIFNDDDSLGALDDDDNGPGALDDAPGGSTERPYDLNDEENLNDGRGDFNDDKNVLNDDIDGFDDENDGPNDAVETSNDEGDELKSNDDNEELNDVSDGTGILNDDFGGFSALNDEDSGPGALDDYDESSNS